MLPYNKNKINKPNDPGLYSTLVPERKSGGATNSDQKSTLISNRIKVLNLYQMSANINTNSGLDLRSYWNEVLEQSIYKRFIKKFKLMYIVYDKLHHEILSDYHSNGLDNIVCYKFLYKRILEANKYFSIKDTALLSSKTYIISKNIRRLINHQLAMESNPTIVRKTIINIIWKYYISNDESLYNLTSDINLPHNPEPHCYLSWCLQELIHISRYDRDKMKYGYTFINAYYLYSVWELLELFILGVPHMDCEHTSYLYGKFWQLVDEVNCAELFDSGIGQEYFLSTGLINDVIKICTSYLDVPPDRPTMMKRLLDLL